MSGSSFARHAAELLPFAVSAGITTVWPCCGISRAIRGVEGLPCGISGKGVRSMFSS